MLTIQCTPNYAGIEVKGDYFDLEALYDAMHEVIGDESEFGNYEGARFRVLGVCYDLRHAIMGDREFEYVDNGMDADKMKTMALVGPEKNLYYKFKIYLPEALFVAMALNDFILLYARKRAKKESFPLLDKRNLWNTSTAYIRIFQSELARCLKEAVNDASYSRLMNLLFMNYLWLDGYLTQYLDFLNIRYLNMHKADRQKNIPLMAKRLVERGKEYQKLKQDVIAVAKQNNCLPDDIELSEDYPEKVEW